MSTLRLPWLLALAACSAGPAPVEPTPAAAEPVAVAPAPPPVVVTAPAPATAPAEDPVLGRAKLANGLSAILYRCEPSPTGEAELLLGLLAGTDVGKQGLADLALYLLLHNGDVTAGRPGLATTIARLGGTIGVEQGPLSTWISVRVPQARWRAALQAFAQALAEPPPGRSQLERLQNQLVEQRTRSIQGDSVRQLATRFLLGDAGTGDHLAALQDRDPGEAMLFQARNYRPDRAVIALAVPGEIAAVANAITEDLNAWKAAAIAPDPQAGPHDRRLQHGLFWSPGDGDAQVVLLLPEPPPQAALAPPVHLLLNCLTLDGVGGRLERMQLEQGLGRVDWVPSYISCGEAGALALSTRTTAERAWRLWQIVLRARDSLRDLPPTASELERARARARLTLRRGDAEARSARRVQTMRVLNNFGDDQLAAQLAALEQPAPVSPEQLGQWLQMPITMIVVGGKPPADATDVRPFDFLPAPVAGASGGPATIAGADAALPWLERALEAVGGRARVLQLSALQIESTITAAGAPTVDETIEWSLAGNLRRVRTLLGASIETRIDAKSWTEQSGAEKHRLSPAEARWRTAEVERHPLLLLAAYAGGKLRFRLLATRRVDDREHIVLEALGDQFDRLRIHIDAESGLLRTVECWATAPDGTPTWFVETWSDHRTVDGLRVPFRRVTVVDDGQSRRVATVRTFVPELKQP